jgi:transcriptional regulator with GAF, ATPase, and Fis domain
MAQQHGLARTLVELADTLVADFDVVDFLHILVLRCTELFDAAEAGLMLADQRGGLRVVASSSERARLLELSEVQNEQGPCLDCLRSGTRVVSEDLEADAGRWPLFAPEALKAGFRSVHALALRCQSQVIGALNIFRTAPGALQEVDLVAAQAMADVATIGILQQRAVQEARVLAEQLQSALNSRVVIEQAKGVLAERAQVNLDDAFGMLRGYARNHNSRLRDVAEAVITGTVVIERLRRPRRGQPPVSGKKS